MFKEMIEDFEKIFAKTGKVDKVILLGDVKHSFGKILHQEWSDVLKLFEYLKQKCKRIVITKGNHDSILAPIVKKIENVTLVNYCVWKNYGFLHGNKKYEEILNNKEIESIIIGHVHPAIEISDGTKREKYKCFLIGRVKQKEMIVVPSFFSLVEGSDPMGSNVSKIWGINFGKFRAKVVGANLEVLDFGKLNDLK